MVDKKHTLTLTDNASGKSIELQVVQGTHGPPVVDIGALYRDFGYFTYDPGFVSTASCRSAITFIDGDQGVSALPRISHRAVGGEEFFP